MTEVLFSFGPYLIITVSANGQTRARALGCKSVEAKTDEANLHTEKPLHKAKSFVKVCDLTFI